MLLNDLERHVHGMVASVRKSIADKWYLVNGNNHVFCKLFFAQDRVGKALAIAS